MPLKLPEGGRRSGASTPRGRGRGRGRGRPSYRGRGPGRPPKSESEEMIIFEDGEMKGIKMSDITQEDFLDSVDVDGSYDTSNTYTPPIVKRGRGRPKKVQNSPVSSTEVKPSSPNDLDSAVNIVGAFLSEENVSDIKVESDSEHPLLAGPRRSSRAMRGLGRLSKYFKLPGESTSEEEGTDGGEGEDEDGVRPTRKRFGIAMAASLRKAALDDLTSPAMKKRKTYTPTRPQKPDSKVSINISNDTKAETVTTIVSKPSGQLKGQGQGDLSDSINSKSFTIGGNTLTVTVQAMEGGEEVALGAGGDRKEVKVVTFEKPVVMEKEKLEDMNEAEEGEATVPEVDQASPRAGMVGPDVESESPKKYIVITKGDTTTAYEIPADFQV